MTSFAQFIIRWPGGLLIALTLVTALGRRCKRAAQIKFDFTVQQAIFWATTTSSRTPSSSNATSATTMG